MPKCSFIVSAYDQFDELILLLMSLKMQTEPDWEAIVCDNHPAARNSMPIAHVGDPRIRTVWTGEDCKSCYESANRVAPQAKGEFLCFPSCDDYYVPQFLSLMLRQSQADLIYCDFVHDPRDATGNGHHYYRVINAEPKIGTIDKAGFLLRRRRFLPFPWERNGEGHLSADGMLVEDLVRSGIRTAKAPGVLWVHN
jgi:Glycosyl transferase family 2